MSEQGNLSINSENMFPIIKKWLYSDHDIFVREVISNGCDAITKRKKLALMGECELPDDYEGRIDVAVNPNEKTMTFTDNGLGMTADEVREYINNIAFSGAKDFLEKYKDKATSDQIIGHFGLGFYSVFMVSGDVEIDTLSYQQGAEPVHWECDGGYSYTMDRGSRTQPGTTITLHLTDDCVEFANYYKAKETIQKYCSFMPYEIYLRDETTTDTETIKESERRPDDVVIEELPPEEKKEEKAADKPIENDDPNKADSAMDAEKKADGEEAGAEKPAPEKRYKIRRRPELLNDTHPLWTKTPKDCTDEEYKEFYRKTFHDYREPLFWIHLNMDYPFNLKGILYFPKINLEYENAEGVIKLYNNQVFVADNIKEVIPEYLMLLKGVIDCPDLPLNVSRSALQNDGFAQKISDYITKKVADKLSGMCKTDRENYEKYWDDISPFIKYGCLKDEKFCERMTDYILFRDLDGKYVVLPDALEINKDAGKEEKPAEKAEPEILDADGRPIQKEGNKEILGADGKPIAAEAGKESGAENKTQGASENGASGTAESGEGSGAESASASEEKKDDTKDADKDKKVDRTIYYVTDPRQQGQYISMFRAQKMQAFIMDRAIDVPFIQQLEMKNEGIHFARIDSGVQDALKGRIGKKAGEDLKKDEEKVTKTVRDALGRKDLKVELTKLKDKKTAAMLTVDEQTRRYAEMMKMYASSGMGGMDMGNMLKEGQTLVLNASHPLVQYVMNHESGSSTKLICQQLFDLAQLQNAPLEPEEMAKFVERSNEVLEVLTKDGGENVTTGGQASESTSKNAPEDTPEDKTDGASAAKTEEK